MISLDQRMNELLEETVTWPEVDRIHHVRAEMNKVYAVIQTRNHQAMVAAHEAKFGRNPSRRQN